MRKIYYKTWYGLNDTFTFGKFKGKSLLDVFKDEPGYIDWCLREIDTFFLLTDTYKILREVSPNYKFSDKALQAIKDKKDKSDYIYNIDDYDDDYSITMDWFGYNGPISGFDRYLEENGLDK